MQTTSLILYATEARVAPLLDAVRRRRIPNRRMTGARGRPVTMITTDGNGPAR
jgi:hypothetical protein